MSIINDFILFHQQWRGRRRMLSLIVNLFCHFFHPLSLSLRLFLSLELSLFFMCTWDAVVSENKIQSFDMCCVSCCWLVSIFIASQSTTQLPYYNIFFFVHFSPNDRHGNVQMKRQCVVMASAYLWSRTTIHLFHRLSSECDVFHFYSFEKIFLFFVSFLICYFARPVENLC